MMNIKMQGIYPFNPKPNPKTLNPESYMININIIKMENPYHAKDQVQGVLCGEP